MIKIQGKLPRTVYIACSGGVDSMAVLHFLENNHAIKPLFVNHGTETSHEAEEFLVKRFGSELIKTSIRDTAVPKNTSREEHWRIERYRIFHSFDVPIITCHHLDDCVETWLWSSLNGNPGIIPYRNRNVIRPFRLNRKNEFIKWCQTKDICWVEDKTNVDTKYIRNYIRHELVPRALVVNPGLHKVVMKKVREDEPTYFDCRYGGSDGHSGSRQDGLLSA